MPHKRFVNLPRNHARQTFDERSTNMGQDGSHKLNIHSGSNPAYLDKVRTSLVPQTRFACLLLCLTRNVSVSLKVSGVRLLDLEWTPFVLTSA